MSDAAEHKTRTVLAGVIGNALEWYDFALFGYFAPVLATLFFPAESRLAGLLSAFGVFAAGFLMRPIGGVIFGHIGDRVGRKKALELSVLLMALPTTAMGLLPTHAQIGLAAPLLLTAIRLLQGLSVGGELIGSISFLAEHAPAGRRGLLGSWSFATASGGTLIGSATAAVLEALLAPDELARWGWRVPFLCGILVGAVGLWLRHGIDETPRFKEAVGAGDVAASPVGESLRRDGRAVLRCLGVSLLMAVAFYLTFVWLPAWLSEINQPRLLNKKALEVNTIAMALLITLVPAFGALSDRVGRRPVMLAGAAGYALLTYPLFLLLERGTYAAALAGEGALAVCYALVNGPSAAAFVEMFPTRTRYSGVAVGYNLAMGLVGGTTPVLATWLVGATGYNLAPAWLLSAAAVVAAPVLWRMPERRGCRLD
jgi:MHS family proline/betaine transporter-like MFS transporter